MLHEGIGISGPVGTAGWTIDRSGIAIAMAQGGSFKMRPEGSALGVQSQMD
jgi:hypothetical protein